MRGTRWLLALTLMVDLALLSAWLLAGQPTPALADAAVADAIRYVAPYGDDANWCDSVTRSCRTVQRAIDVAQTFDEIRIAAGTYTDPAGTVANIDKTITLLGGWNSAFTTRDPNAFPSVLDAQRQGRVVYISGPISPTIDGFVITGGDAHDESQRAGEGGGVCSVGSSPIIQNNVIIDNIAYRGTTPWGFGGGIYLTRGTGAGVISGNRIVSNTACSLYHGLGGGVCLFLGAARVSGNEIEHNTSGAGGAGVYLYESHGSVFSENHIISNTTTISPALSGIGGGLYIEFTSPFTLANNVIAQNYANNAGGLYVHGYANYESRGELVNNTIAQNNLGPGGEAISESRAATLTLTNNIIVGHTYALSGLGVIRARYTLFYDNALGDIRTGGHISSTHEITGQDPQFANPAAWDYHLRQDSPAIDAGDPAGVPPAPPIDIDGQLRPIGPRVDIGADEVRRLSLFLPLVLKSHASQ